MASKGPFYQLIIFCKAAVEGRTRENICVQRPGPFGYSLMGSGWEGELQRCQIGGCEVYNHCLLGDTAVHFRNFLKIQILYAPIF